MSNTAVLRLDQTERFISLTLTLPRPAFRRRPARKRAEIRADRPFGLNEAAFFTQRPQI